jgi:hypothetical protein
VGDHDTLTTKSTYRSLSAQRLSERTAYAKSKILIVTKNNVPVKRLEIMFCIWQSFQKLVGSYVIFSLILTNSTVCFSDNEENNPLLKPKIF